MFLAAQAVSARIVGRDRQGYQEMRLRLTRSYYNFTRDRHEELSTMDETACGLGSSKVSLD